METEKINDETLLRLITRQQEHALSELYDRYSRLVYSIALNALGDPEQAEEITQEVFISIWQKANTYQIEQGKVSTWIASITRHRAIDEIRRRKTRLEIDRSPWESENLMEIAAPGNVEKEVELSLRKQRVRRAIAQLPEEQRQALAYAYFQGYSHSQIAEVLNEPLGTVKTRIRLAMQKMQQILQDEAR